ncbi:MAG: hypothetical protein Q4C88_09735, partial [Akkermansia sp.]|nr:hypothetical protein [Akkermansia sp.]
MNKLSTAALAVLAAALPLHAAVRTYMVRGVTEAKGWYDGDKSGPSDRQMCWAASAANMIAWWQDRNADTHGQTQAPTGKNVWETMKKAFDNTAGSPMAATNWWFSKNKGPRPNGAKENLGGYYDGIIAGKDFNVVLHNGPGFGSQLPLSERLKELIQAGNGVCVGIQKLVNGRQMQNGAHMISLWGIDFDEDKKVVTRVYLTDSDDALGYSASMQKGLFVADCTWAEDVKGPGGQPFPTLIMDTESPWFENNTVITSIVTFSGNNDFLTDKDKEENAKNDAAQDAKEAKSIAKKPKK